MKEITNALNRMYEWMEVNIPEFADAFQYGLSYKEIQSAMSGISLQLPEEIYDLYQWRNGVDSNVFLAAGVYSSGDFLRLNQSLEQYQNLIEQDFICENPFVLDLLTTYNKNLLFPFYDADGYRYCVILTPEKMSSSPIISISCEGGFSLRYQSLAAMFSVIAECYETGAYYVETENEYQGSIGSNEKEVSKILKKYNPELLGKVLSNLTSLTNGEKNNLDEYDYLEFTYSVLGQLRRFREVESVEMLLDYLNHLNSIPRSQQSESAIAETIYTLGYMEDSRVIPYISEALNDQSTFIKYRAEEALIEQNISQN